MHAWVDNSMLHRSRVFKCLLNLSASHSAYKMGYNLDGTASETIGLCALDSISVVNDRMHSILRYVLRLAEDKRSYDWSVVGT